MNVDLHAQIRCVERELRYRAHVYPRRVAEGRMTQQKADMEMAVMEAVLATLRAQSDVQPRQGELIA